MRKPTIQNKYNLTPYSVTKLKVNRKMVDKTYFWRNNVVHAWCISGNTAKSAADHEFGTYNSFWLGIYDEDCLDYPGKIHLNFSSHGGMCNYVFNTFYDFSAIECEIDLEIQEKFLEVINYLIDEGVFILP